MASGSKFELVIGATFQARKPVIVETLTLARSTPSDRITMLSRRTEMADDYHDA